jgi:hypothetical protein
MNTLTYVTGRWQKFVLKKKDVAAYFFSEIFVRVID